MAKQIANPTKAQIADNVKAASKAKIQAAKASIEDSKKKIDKAKEDIKAAKSNIKSQKAIIKAAKTATKNAKIEAKAEAATQKAAKKAEKAAKKADKAAEKVSDDDSHRESPEKLGKFVIKTTAKESVMFNLCNAQGKVIALSQVYTSVDSCQNGIRSVAVNAPKSEIEDQTAEGYYTVLPSPKFELYIDKGGNDYRFRLKAKNGQNILASGAFKTKDECLAGIESVKLHSQTKIIDEE